MTIHGRTKRRSMAGAMRGRAGLCAILVVLAGCSMPEQELRAQGALSQAQLAALVTEIGIDSSTRVLVGAGDIARCSDLEPALATAALIEAVVAAAGEARVFTTGDHAYENGTAEEFERCYGPSWGRFEPITRPTPGNHDYRSEDAAPYFDYFSHFASAPDAWGHGYYSYEFAGWHVVALNSVLPLDEGSPQLQWLAQDLGEATSRCLLAYWHHPRFSASLRSLMPWARGRATKEVWNLLGMHDAELVLNGHEHFYERYAPQDGRGRPKSDGIRQITAGTGGGELQAALRERANSELRLTGIYGVLVLVLTPESYRWTFVGTDGAIHDQSPSLVPCTG